MRVYLTGGTGFIGSNLAKYFIDDGSIVGILKRKNSDTSYLENYIERISFFDYNNDFESLNKSIKDFRPDIIIHLAAYQVYYHNSDDIDKMLNANIRLGIYLLESMRINNVRNFINTGSFYEHGRGDKNISPINLYAATKISFKKILDYYHSTEKISCITLKLFDVYGLGDKRNKLLVYIKENLRNSKILELSPGEQTMDLVYIEDIVDAYKICIDKLINTMKILNQEFYLSSGNRIKLKKLIELIQKLTNSRINYDLGSLPYRKNEIFRPIKGVQLKEWTPKYDIEKGLKKYFNNA